MEVARIKGLVIKVHPTFWLVLVAYGALGQLREGLTVFLLVMAHELAHLLAAKAYGFRVIGLEVFPFGGAAYCEDLFAGRKKEESLLALAGPALNFILMFGGLMLKEARLWEGVAAEDFIRFNFWLAAFNLIPVLPLDGGRVARALLVEAFGFVGTTKFLARVGQIFGGMLGLWGLARAGNGNTLGEAGSLVILAFFFFHAGKQEIFAARLTFLRQLAKKKEELLHKGLLKGKTLAVAADCPLIRIVEKLTPDRYALISLPEEDFGLKKLITETQIVDGMLKHGIHYPVGKL